MIAPIIRAALALTLGLAFAGHASAQEVDPTARGLAAAALTRVPGIVTPVIGSTGAAASNTARINAALTNAGHAAIDCNGTFYVGSTIYLKSYQRLDITPSCTMKAYGVIGSLVANNASSNINVPWTTTQLNTTGTASPLSMIWSGSTPAWAASTAYTVSATGTYVTNNGNIYWLATAGTTASSGGPSGAGVGITDGTAVWNYVTTNQASPNSTYQSAAIYWPSHGLSVGDVAWVTPQPDGQAPRNWAGTTAYTAGQIIQSNSNQYVETASTCSSGSTGPTLTTYTVASPYSDGSCSWAYMSPTGAMGSTLYWSGAEPGNIAGGYADSAYFGIFTVTAVNDANWVTVALRRQPAAPFSGIPMWVKKGDTDIYVGGGGTFNFNFSGGNSGGSSLQARTGEFALVFGGVRNLTIDGAIGADTQKYVLDLTGTVNAIVRGVQGSCTGTNSDRIKVYGPAFDTVLENSAGCAGDDVLSLQTQDVPPFNRATLAAGDILGFRGRNISANTGIALTIYVNQPYLLTDQLFFQDVNIRNYHATNRSPIAIYNGAPVGVLTSTLGSLHIQGATVMSSNQCLIHTYSPYGSAMVLQSVFLDTVESNYSQSQAINGNATGCIFDNTASATTVNNLTLQNVKSQLQYNYASATDMVVRAGQPGSPIGNVVIRGGYFSDSVAGNGMLFYSAASTGLITKFVVEDSYIKDLAGIARLYQVSDVTLTRNVMSSSSNMQGVGLNVAGARIHLNSNYFTNLNFGAVRYNGVYAATIFSDGGNYLGGTSLLVGNPGTSNANLVGSTPVNLIDGAVGAVPTVNACGSGSTIAAGSNGLAGTITIPASTTTCTYNIPPGAFPFAPRGIVVTAVGSTPAAVNGAVSYTSLTSGTFSIYSAGGATVNYQILP